MFCYFCGAVLPDGARFCSKCGIRASYNTEKNGMKENFFNHKESFDVEDIFGNSRNIFDNSKSILSKGKNIFERGMKDVFNKDNINSALDKSKDVLNKSTDKLKTMINKENDTKDMQEIIGNLVGLRYGLESIQDSLDDYIYTLDTVLMLLDSEWDDKDWSDYIMTDEFDYEDDEDEIEDDYEIEEDELD